MNLVLPSIMFFHRSLKVEGEKKKMEEEEEKFHIKL